MLHSAVFDHQILELWSFVVSESGINGLLVLPLITWCVCKSPQSDYGLLKRSTPSLQCLPFYPTQHSQKYPIWLRLVCTDKYPVKLLSTLPPIMFDTSLTATCRTFHYPLLLSCIEYLKIHTIKIIWLYFIHYKSLQIKSVCWSINSKTTWELEMIQIADCMNPYSICLLFWQPLAADQLSTGIAGWLLSPASCMHEDAGSFSAHLCLFTCLITNWL